MFDLIQIMKDREYKIDIIYENLILFNKKIESQEDVQYSQMQLKEISDSIEEKLLISLSVQNPEANNSETKLIRLLKADSLEKEVLSSLKDNVHFKIIQQNKK